MTTSSRALLAVLLGALLAGCADAPVAPPADPLAADAAYARAMIPHHEQALELAALVGGRSRPTRASPSWRCGSTGSRSRSPASSRGCCGRGAATPRGRWARGWTGWRRPATLARLGASSGPAFDRLWLETMIAHHEGAIDDGPRPPRHRDRPTLRRFSDTVVRAQGQEIDLMRGVLARLP